MPLYGRLGSLSCRRMSLLLLVYLLLSVWRTEAQSIYIDNTTPLVNNSKIFFTDFGEGSNAVSCRSSQPGCCKNPNVGQWYYPNGEIVPNRFAGQGFYRNRDMLGNVFLHRRNDTRAPAGVYSCDIPDDEGVTNRLHLGIYSPEDHPVVTQNPISQINVAPGTDVVFNIESIQSTSYYWYRGQSGLSELESKYKGIHNKSLTILDVRKADAGIYSCFVGNDLLSVLSGGAFLTILDAPVLLSEASDVEDAALGDDVTFLVIARGLNIQYSWEYDNGSSLPTTEPRFTGVQTNRLTISNLRLSDGGLYTCVVSNAGGNVNSSASLTIRNIHLIQVITVMPFITAAQVSWTPPTSMEDNFDYDLQYYPTSFPSLVVTLNTNHTSLLVIGLLPQLHYHFQVRVANVDQPTWAMADVQLQKKIPPVDNFSALIIDGSFIHFSWVPTNLPGWTISYYYMAYSAYLPSKTLREFTRRFVVKGNLSSETLSMAELSMSPEVSHVFELSIVLTIEGLEGIREVKGDTAITRISLNYDMLPFQIMIGPIDYCILWGKSKANMIRAFLREAIVEAINSRCGCYFSEKNLGSGFFSCRTSQTTAIYRSSVVGLNSTDLIGHIQDWVLSSQTIMLEWFIVDVIDSCPVGILSLHDEDYVIPVDGT